jgi:PKD repeat protein
LQVSFIDESTYGPTAWTWAFGDGGTSTEQHPVHTYDNAGTFTVTLTVSNAVGSNALIVPNCITVHGRPGVYLPIVLRD